MQTLPDRIVEPVHRRAAIFNAFGLRLDVDPSIDISGLGFAEIPSGSGLPGTRIRLDPEELERRWSASRVTRRMRELHDGESVVLAVDFAEPAGYLLQAREVGRFLVGPTGTEVLCDPLPGFPNWAFIFPAQILPLVATLKGCEVLHASGVVIGEAATLFSGAPGAGKSSLAAALFRRGAQLIGDDAIALEQCDGSLVAHRSVGLVHLRPGEYDRLSVAERNVLGVPVPFAGKQSYATDTITAPVAFGALFLLERSQGGAMVEHIEDVDPFDLLAATFSLSVRTPERLNRQLDVVEDLVATKRIYRLRVLPDTNATRLAAAVERHLASLIL